MYGTLLPGHAPLALRGAVARLAHRDRGRTRGDLYDLGSYPGAVLDERAPSWIFGEVFRLPPDPRVLERLDRYEGFDPAAPADSLFRRAYCTVSLRDGAAVDSWIYVYNRDPSGAARLPGGDYRAHVGRQAGDIEPTDVRAGGG